MNQSKEYKKYISSNEWYQIKIDCITNRGSKCEICLKSTIYLQLHHLTYVRLFNELPQDLQLLCATCHQKVHGLIPVKRKAKAIKTKKPKQVKKYKLNKRDKALQKRYDALKTNKN
jgi:5-methylcytosine-specific restriction endonuclease McrA